jgi:hypothetical protein
MVSRTLFSLLDFEDLLEIFRNVHGFQIKGKTVLASLCFVRSFCQSYEQLNNYSLLLCSLSCSDKDNDMSMLCCVQLLGFRLTLGAYSSVYFLGTIVSVLATGLGSVVQPPKHKATSSAASMGKVQKSK